MIQADWVEAAAVADFGRAIQGKGGGWVVPQQEKGRDCGKVDLSLDPCMDSIASQKKVPALNTHVTRSLSPPQQSHRPTRLAVLIECTQSTYLAMKHFASSIAGRYNSKFPMQ